MFFETSYNDDGLGDCAADVRAYESQGHVFSGARLTYTFTGTNSSWIPFSGIFTDWQATIANAIAQRGYQNVSVNITSAVVGEGHGTISAISPVDHAHYNDAKNNFRSAIQGAGVAVSSDNMSVQNPTVSQICAGQSAGQPPKGTTTGGTVSGSSSVSGFFDNFASGLGVSTPIAMVLAGVAAVLLLKR